MYPIRVLSGMRPTGALHLGHYHGVLKNWQQLQQKHFCLFFAADWHALTTHYAEPQTIAKHTHDMIIDWLAAGIDPNQSILFVQSQVVEHAELHLLLAMMTPLGWLERVPTYKDQQENLRDKELSTYGFLGYPLLQAADILLYRACKIPVGEDQIPHVEITREIARRFNHLYGQEEDFTQKAISAAKKMGNKRSKLYLQLRQRFQEQGDEEALQAAYALLSEQQNLSVVDKERLFGFLDGTGKLLLLEPEYMLTNAPCMPGLDGRKMSKSYQNYIGLREDPAIIRQKIKTMPTDPQRIRRTDPGNPEKCPVFQLHRIYSKEDTLRWITSGCQNAHIGCLDCKEPVIQAILEEQISINERAQPYLDDPTHVKDIIADGCEKARKIAQETMRDVRAAMQLDY